MKPATLSLVVSVASMQLLGRHLLAGAELDRALDGHPAHQLSLLRGGDVEDAVLQRLERRGVAVEAGEPDFCDGVGHLDRLRRAERERVGLAEDDADVRMGLQHVLHELEALVLAPDVRILLRHDLDARVGSDDLRAALHAVDLGRGALLAVDDDHLALAAGLLMM